MPPTWLVTLRAWIITTTDVISSSTTAANIVNFIVLYRWLRRRKTYKLFTSSLLLGVLTGAVLLWRVEKQSKLKLCCKHDRLNRFRVKRSWVYAQRLVGSAISKEVVHMTVRAREYYFIWYVVRICDGFGYTFINVFEEIWIFVSQKFGRDIVIIIMYLASGVTNTGGTPPPTRTCSQPYRLGHMTIKERFVLHI